MSADYIWMKRGEKMNVRQRNRGKGKRMSEGCGELPVIWKMENKISNATSPEHHFLKGNGNFSTVMTGSGLL